MKCNNKCNCECGNSKSGPSARQVATVLEQMKSALRKIDSNGVLAGLAKAIMVGGMDSRAVYNGYCRMLCRRGMLIVRVVEDYCKKYPDMRDRIVNSAMHMFQIYIVICKNNLADFKEFAGMDQPYVYLKRLARGADRIFDLKCASGFGVRNSMDHADFSETKFICDEESGVSGMHVEKAGGISEKVVVRNSEETFDYEKAAMALLLKAVFGGDGTSVDIVRFVEQELRKANETQSAKKARRAEKKAEKKAGQAVDDGGITGDGDGSEYVLGDEFGDPFGEDPFGDPIGDGITF